LPLRVQLEVNEDKRTPWQKILIEESFPQPWRFLEATSSPTVKAAGKVTWFFAGKSLEPLVGTIVYRLHPAEFPEGDVGRFSGQGTLSTDLGVDGKRYAIVGTSESRCEWQLRAARQATGKCDADGLVVTLTLKKKTGSDVKAVVIGEDIPSGWIAGDVSPQPGNLAENQIVWVVPDEADDWQEHSFTYRLRPKGPRSANIPVRGKITWQSNDLAGELLIGGVQALRCSN
jgi:hypothetical protein